MTTDEAIAALRVCLDWENCPGAECQAIRHLAALTADAKTVSAAIDTWDKATRALESHETTCLYATCDFRGCPHEDVWRGRQEAVEKLDAALVLARARGWV